MPDAEERFDFSVVVPVLNEVENVEQLFREIAEIAKSHWEVIFVDDGSRDGTCERLQQLRSQTTVPLRIIRHRHNLGQSTAIHTGIRAARAPWVVTLDGDGQNDPGDIPALIRVLASRDSSSDLMMVCGYRRRRNDSLLKRISSRVANAVRCRLLRDRTPDTGCGLKLINRAAFMALPFFDHMHRFLPALMQRAGADTLSVEVNHRPRTRGNSKYGLRNRLWVGIIDLIGVIWLQRRARVSGGEEL